MKWIHSYQSAGERFRYQFTAWLPTRRSPTDWANEKHSAAMLSLSGMHRSRVLVRSFRIGGVGVDVDHILHNYHQFVHAAVRKREREY